MLVFILAWQRLHNTEEGWHIPVVLPWGSELPRNMQRSGWGRVGEKNSILKFLADTWWVTGSKYFSLIGTLQAPKLFS